MRQKLGQSIRTARRAAGLTQEQLGRRIGLKGQAVYRWENNDSSPTKRHQRELVSVIRAVNPDAAAVLSTQFAGSGRQAVAVAPGIAIPQPAIAASNGADALELSVLRMADELDLPPRRVRRPLARLLTRLKDAEFTLESAHRQLEAWIAEQG